MPNRAALWRQRVAADTGSERPVVERVRNGLTVDLGSGQRRLMRTVGPVHTWGGQEIDTDWEPGGLGFRARRLDFGIEANEAGHRRITPRPELPDEHVTVGRPQWDRNGWRNIPITAMSAEANVITFAGPGPDIQLVVKPDGIRTRIVVEDDRQVLPFRWPLTLSGLRYEAGVLYSLSDGEPVMWLGTPRWWDSGGLDTAMGGEIAYDWDGSYLTYRPQIPADAAYPVILDPDFGGAVAATADDGYVREATSADNAGAWVAAGRVAGKIYNAYFRFDNVTVPNAATVTVCHLDLRTTSDSIGSGTVYTNLYFVKEADSDPPANRTEWEADDAILTTAFAAWDFTLSDTDDTGVESADFSAAAEEVFALVGWALGQAIQVHLNDDGTGNGVAQAWASYDHASYAAPEIDITYSTATAQTVTLGLLSPVTLYAPTVKPTVTLPLLTAAAVHTPTVAREEIVTLGLLEPLTLYEPVVARHYYLGDAYPNDTAVSAGYYLEGWNDVPNSRSVLWFWPQDGSGYWYQFNWAPEDDNCQAHFDLFQWTGGYLYYIETQDNYASPNTRMLYSPAIKYMPDEWTEGDTFYVSDNTTGYYYEGGGLVKTGAVSYVSQIVGVDADGVHVRVDTDTTWDTDPVTYTHWQEHFWFKPIGAYWGIYKAYGGNEDIGYPNWDITFGPWTALPEKTVTLDLLAATTLYAPTVESTVTLPLLAPTTLYEPTVSTAAAPQTITLPLLTAASVYAPQVNVTLSLPLLAATALYAPVVQPTLTLPLISAATLWEPTVHPTVSIPFLEPVTLWAPTLTPTVTLPLLAPATLYEPNVSVASGAQTITLPLLAATAVYEPTVAGEQPLTLPALALTVLYGPQVQPTVELPRLDPLTIYEPDLIAVCQPVTLPLLEATSLYGPALIQQAVLELPLIAGTVLYQPTLSVEVTLPLLEPVSLYEPALVFEWRLELPLLQPVTIYAPASISKGYEIITLPVLAALTLYAPTEIYVGPTGYLEVELTALDALSVELRAAQTVTGDLTGLAAVAGTLRAAQTAEMELVARQTLEATLKAGAHT